MDENNEPHGGFKEEDLKKNHHFNLNIESNHVVAPDHASSTDHVPVPEPQKKDDEEEFEKRDFKTILKDAGRQLAASFIILVVGFLILNWSAYYQIGQHQWDQWFGAHTPSPLTQLVENQPVNNASQSLATSNSADVQKKQIPPLQMDIAPADDRLIIPRIDQNIPVVKISSDSLIKRDWNALEKDMQAALQDGVVHYPGTSLPSQTGNVVITGHSSYFPWDPGRFKDVFALLHDVVVGDKIVYYYNQDKYTYEVTNIKVVLPDNIDVLKQTPDNVLTLITCTPVGTNLKRLIVTAKQIAKNDQPL